MKGEQSIITTNLLYENKVFKDYQELCKALGEGICGGEKKVYQLREWARYFSYSKNGRTYRIEEIYREPKERVDGRKKKNMNNRIYGEALETLLLSYLWNNPVPISNQSLFHVYRTLEITKMDSRNYGYLISELESQLQVKLDRRITKEFYQQTRTCLASALNSVLVSLKNQGLVDYKVKEMAFCHSDKTKLREATDEEVAREKELRHEVLDEMGLGCENDVFWRDKTNEFQTKLQSLLYKEFGIDYIYSAYDIWLVSETQDIQDILCDKSVDTLDELRSLFVERFIQNARKRQIELLERYFGPDDIPSYRAKESYIEQCTNLSHFFFR